MVEEGLVTGVDSASSAIAAAQNVGAGFLAGMGRCDDLAPALD